MKRIFLLAVTVALIGAFKVGATTVTVNRIPGYYATGFDGGEFNITPAVGSISDYANSVIVNGGNETFCVEPSVKIVIPGVYTASLSQTDSQGTALTEGTAWLYMEFAEGTLSGYDYSTVSGNGTFTSRAIAAEYLQNTIWELQGQGYDASLASYYYGIASSAIGAGNLGLADNGLYNVAIVNLYNANGQAVQNMLALVPDGGSTVMLFGLALSGLGLMFVRKAKKT